MGERLPLSKSHHYSLDSTRKDGYANGKISNMNGQFLAASLRSNSNTIG